MPCLQVNLDGGVESGFAIVRDPRGGTQFLLIPTTRISGIESPIVREPHAVNYFADAWEARTLINDALHLTLPRDDIGLAINSSASRSQNQLHIHLSCIRADIWKALHENESKIGSHWAPLNVSLAGHYYSSMWIASEDLVPFNPFALLAQLPNSTQDMAKRTLVVVGFTRRDQTKGFVILTDQANKDTGDVASGEELLDRSCEIALAGDKMPGNNPHGDRTGSRSE
jgi:CDP-diacylglycerol pyrophosphatase